MDILKLIFSLLVMLQTNYWASVAAMASSSVFASPAAPGSSLSQFSNVHSNGFNTKDSSAAAALGSLYRKSRQLRCPRCYDDRYPDDYLSWNSRSGYYKTDGGGYSSGRSAADDRSGSWYYPRDQYDRYEDRKRYVDDRDYERNDGRYVPRSYDRYEGHGGYNDRRFYDRLGSQDRGYGYERSDRYTNDRSGDYYRNDRYNDRVRGGSYDGRGGNYDSRSYYDRDTIDRYHTRYRPWDDTTYRGQSGSDTSGRGYYFASNDRQNGDDYVRGRLPLESSTHDTQDYQAGFPCRSHSSSCYYPSSAGGIRPRPDNVSSADSNSNNSSGDSGGGNKKNNYAGRWSYIKDREKDGVSSFSAKDNRDNDNQSSSYGGRPSRPLGGSYLLDRDSHIIPGSSEGGASFKNNHQYNTGSEGEPKTKDASSESIASASSAALTSGEGSEPKTAMKKN